MPHLIDQVEFVRRLTGAKTVSDLMLIQADLTADAADCLKKVAAHAAASRDLQIAAPESKAADHVAALPHVLEAAQVAPITIEKTVTGEKLVDVFQVLEGQDRFVDVIYFNARDYADVRKFGREVLDFETRTSMINLGAVGSMYGAAVYCSASVPVGWIHLASLPIAGRPLLAVKVQVVR